MHADCPLMANLDQSANLVEALHIATCRYEPTQSKWGFDEVGQNHQSPGWTLDGTVEVAVNLFMLYVYEFLCGIPVAQNWRGAAAFRAEQMAPCDCDNADFDQWKRDQLLVRFSLQVGRNLGPYFETWGMPPSQAARDSVADLPTQLPHDFPPINYERCSC